MQEKVPVCGSSFFPPICVFDKELTSEAHLPKSINPTIAKMK
jgi:hypothetical protein